MGDTKKKFIDKIAEDRNKWREYAKAIVDERNTIREQAEAQRVAYDQMRAFVNTVLDSASAMVTALHDALAVWPAERIADVPAELRRMIDASRPVVEEFRDHMRAAEGREVEIPADAITRFEEAEDLGVVECEQCLADLDIAACNAELDNAELGDPPACVDVPEVEVVLEPVGAGDDAREAHREWVEEATERR